MTTEAAFVTSIFVGVVGVYLAAVFAGIIAL